MPFKNVHHAAKEQPSYHCPCCGNLTLHGRGEDEICPVCFWHDDGQDDHDADEVRGGPNYQLSLTQARVNFRSFGAVEKKHVSSVRAPTVEESSSRGGPKAGQRRRPDFRAKVRFFSPEEGGRKSPVFQGYRPDLAYKAGDFELFMIWPRFLDDTLKERAEGAPVPAQSIADFWIANQQLKDDVHRARIRIGTEFWVCEGNHKVAEVVVTDILEGMG